MVRLSHSVFKLILSYKDPRYERVRNEDPLNATPTRVWYTENEFREERGLGRDDELKPFPSDWRVAPWGLPFGAPTIIRSGPEHATTDPQYNPDVRDMDKEIMLKRGELMVYRKYWTSSRYFVAKYFTPKRWFNKLAPYRAIRKYEKDVNLRWLKRWEDTPPYICDKRAAKMSLQCEACGPDLELYEMMRGRRRQ